ncbi:MAG: HAD-IIIA family hydrolase [Desulfarculales bacterium]|jgi:histidinol-phosphate phosphatase family protein|nr:HAD-IIIA family hydrolase [Desulfarculales bacterium]
MLMKAALILAGGKGARLASRLNGLPKPLVEVAGVPLLERQLLHCKSSGIESVLLLVNHRADRVAQFCAQKNNFGLNLCLVDDGEPRGTGGAVLAALPHLASDPRDVLILYGDTLFNIDLERFHAAHLAGGADASLLVHPNTHPQDSDLLELDESGYVVKLHPCPHPQGAEYPNLVNAALYIMKRSLLADFAYLAGGAPRIIDFAKDIFPLLLQEGSKLYGYKSPEYIQDVGTPERLERAEADIFSGRVAKGSLRLPQRAVFLDRDGVLNEEAGYITGPDQLKLVPGSARAVSRLNRAGLLAVVVTNQPVLARGECDEAGLQAVHTRLEHLLGREGAYLDRLYYCPHHPERGFPGERPELKTVCACRKPAPGMLFRAACDLHIDLHRSWLVGDRISDIQCAANVGCRSVLTGISGRENAFFADGGEVKPDFQVKDLAAAVDIILRQES